jgi:uncharacterized protein
MSKSAAQYSACLIVALLFLTPAHGAQATDAAAVRVAGWSDQSYYLPMADGVRLAVSVWFPDGRVPGKKVPVVLIQTRYGRAGVFNYGENRQYRRLLKDGFAVAVVDTRGTTSSFGSRPVEIGPEEVKDMDRLIVHFRTRPWSSGEVFATGVSYMADTADIAAASTARLAGAIVRESDFDAYLDLFTPGGVANEAMMNVWGGETILRDYGRSSDPKQGLDCALRAEDCAKLWPRLQPVDVDLGYRLLQSAIASRVQHWQPDDYRNIEFRDDKARNGYTEFSSSPAAYLEGLKREHIPTQYWGSWMDAGTADAALARYRSLPQVPMEVWITANTHINDRLSDPFLPSETAPRPSIAEQWSKMLGFFDRVRSHQVMPRTIHYYVLGAGSFVTTSQWPPLDSHPVTWRFGPEHTLVREAQAVTDGEDRHRVDVTTTTGDATRWTTQLGTPAAYADRRSEDAKLLCYTSEPFTEDAEVLGNPSVTLYLSSTSADPAFFAYVEDVASDGRVTYLTEGLFRALLRKPAVQSTLPYTQPEPALSFLRKDAQPILPGEVVKIEFPVFPVAALIRKGHRLRLSLAGADRSAFHRYGSDQEEWVIKRTALQPSGLTLGTRPWRRSDD